MPEYNGWTNYETWAANLWLDNDAGSQEMTWEWTREAIEYARDNPNPYQTSDRVAVYRLVETAKEWIEENNPLTDTPSLYSDLLSAAMSEVDWYEIAEHWVEDHETDDPDEDEEEEDSNDL